MKKSKAAGEEQPEADEGAEVVHRTCSDVPGSCWI